MNWAHIENVGAVVASVRGAVSSDFGVFLLLCFAAALGIAAVLVGGVLSVAIVGARRDAARADPARRAAAKAPPPVPGRSLLILYASETGNSRGLAVAAGAAAQRLALKARVADMAAVAVKEAAKATDLLVIASTWGEGEPPQRAVDFYNSLMAPDAPRFDGVRYAVLALGDRAYANFENFCRTGRVIDIRLAELGGTRMAERSECDADYEGQSSEWIGAQLARLSASPTAVPIDAGLGEPGTTGRMHPLDVVIAEKANLNGATSTTSTYHVTLSPMDFDIPYEPGVSIGLFP
jgi:sulfite reductase (NADPH) flavoprotein alpha-component